MIRCSEQNPRAICTHYQKLTFEEVVNEREIEFSVDNESICDEQNTSVEVSILVRCHTEKERRLTYLWLERD